jgi:hypothetical protein
MLALRFFVFIAATSFSQALLLHPAPTQRCSSPIARVSIPEETDSFKFGDSVQALWISEAEAASLGLPTHRVAQTQATESLLGAVVGVSMIAFAGVLLSSSSSSSALSMLQSAGMLDQDILWTDLLMDHMEYANLAGYVVLALSLTNLIVNDEAWAPAQPVLEELDPENEWCLTDDSQGQICGAAQVLEDGMVCVEHIIGGKPQWVCA